MRRDMGAIRFMRCEIFFSTPRSPSARESCVPSETSFNFIANPT